MNKIRFSVKRIGLVVWITFSLLVPVPVMGVKFWCENCGNWWEQLLEKAEAVATAATVAKQLKADIDQLTTMQTNLKSMSGGGLNQLAAQYKAQIDELKKVYDSVQKLRAATKAVREVVKRRATEMQSLNMDPKSYFAAEEALAKQRGGAYQEQLDNDRQAVENARKRNDEYIKLHDSIKNIKGNVEGLQTLAKYSHQMSAELAAIRDVMRVNRNDELESDKAKEEEKGEEFRMKQQILEAKKKGRSEVDGFEDKFNPKIPELIK